ncbi:methyl-directed repair DNA adenine methylase [Microcystis phage Mae-JY22]
MHPRPLIPWIGGKRRLFDRIVPLFPAHTCYVEAFAGAAGILFEKDPVTSEVLNDVNGDLINLYRVVKHHVDEFVRQFRWALASRQLFEWLQITPPETLTDIQRAARFYYLQRMAFGGRATSRSFGTSTTSKPGLNLLRLEQDLSDAHMRLSQVVIEHLDWRVCMQRYDREHTLFYLDPPYWGTEGYGVAFGLEQYDQLAEAMRLLKGKAVMSVNDVPEMRAAFKGFRTKRVDLSYTVGRSKESRAKRAELIVLSW